MSTLTASGFQSSTLSLVSEKLSSFPFSLQTKYSLNPKNQPIVLFSLWAISLNTLFE